MYIDEENKIFRNCEIGCYSCNNMNCLSCVPGYVKIVTSSGSVCRKNSPQIVCDSEYY